METSLCLYNIRYLLAEGGLLAFFAFCFAIPPLASGILGGLAENDQAPCFRINACPNIDRLCEHARSISKIYTGSCLHWSLYYPGVMQISHDGIMKMTFWISFLWMLDVYPGWAIGYTKRIHGSVSFFFLLQIMISPHIKKEQNMCLDLPL